MSGSVREYAVLYLGKGSAQKTGAASGGNVVLTAGTHPLDGPEHSAAGDTTRLNASATAHGLLPKLSGAAGDTLHGDGTWALPVADVTDLPAAETDTDLRLAPDGVGGVQWGPGGTGGFAPDYFNVVDYGAVGDGATDDTVAIQAAIDACHAAGGGVVYFPVNADNGPTYAVKGALQDTGGYNSQLKIPNCTSYVAMRFLGGRRSANISSDWNGTISGTPSVLSCGAHDSLTVSLLILDFEWFSIIVPNDPKLTALDATKAATVRWYQFGVGAAGDTMSAVPTHANSVGVDLPYGLNDQNSGGDALWVQGFYTGIRPGEQFVADAIYATNCKYAVEFRGHEASPQRTQHAVSIQRMNVWYCQVGLRFTGDKRWVRIDLMDVEHDDPSPWTTLYDIDDPSNYARGFVGLHVSSYTAGLGATGASPLVNSAQKLSYHLPEQMYWRLNSQVHIPTGVNPTANPFSGFLLYADAGSGHPYVRDTAGATHDLLAAAITPASTVEAEQSWGISPAVGTDAEYARQDHTHGTPAEPSAGGPGHSHVVDEQFSGNGSTTVFPLANSAVPDSVMAWVAGVRTPVTLGGALDDEISFGSAPASGTLNISVDYAAASG